jgi:pimeloyl-ACP methyl ester carboxylesterase
MAAETATFPTLPAFESRFFYADDGLKLHMRDYRAARAHRSLPVICLPGLARTAADFDRLARALSGPAAQPPRRVVALDYRGRGLSDWDPHPRNYDLKVENADILEVLTAAGIGEAIFVGTSRGGLHLMALGAVRPSVLRGVVLNDIGPVIEKTGLARIRGYVGKMPRPGSFEEALGMVKRISAASFPALSEENWRTYVDLTYEEKGGRLVTRYDPALSVALEAFDLEAPLPDMWPQFEALAEVPTLAIRGANSDLLSANTLAEMVRRHPQCETYTVAGQGHAPLLIDDASISRIATFIAKTDPNPKAQRPGWLR